MCIRDRFDFFWGGVEVPAAPWDAAGEWVLSSYRGQAAFLPADSVELVLADPMAVSYTHLDVYKRQAWRMGRATNPVSADSRPPPSVWTIR